MNSIWNGVYKQSFVASSSKLEYATDVHNDYMGNIPCQLIPWEELPGDMRIDWPGLEPEHLLQLDDAEFGDPDSTWLAKPELMKKAKKSFYRAFEIESDEGNRDVIRRLVRDHYGGMSGLEKMEWAVIQNRGEEGIYTVESFRGFIEMLAVESGRSYWEKEYYAN